MNVMSDRIPHHLRCLLFGTLLALTACQQPSSPEPAQPDPSPIAGVGYVVLNAVIAPATRDLLIAAVDKLKNAGAREIQLGINSPGGDIEAAQGIVDYMTRVHGQDGITFKAYNLGFVASAATYVFLHAEERYSGPRATFLFHAAGMVSTGAVTAERLREEANKLDAYERVVRATLKERSNLTEAEIGTYVRRTVVLNADDARRDGIIDAIASFTPSKGARAWVITAKPKTGTPAGQPVQPVTPSG